MIHRARAACLALIIEKAEPTLTRVELHLSTFISSRNNDLRVRQLSEPEKVGGEVRRARENRFVWHADSEPRRGPERPEEANERHNGMEDIRRTLPLQSGDTGTAPGLYFRLRVMMGFQQIAMLSTLSLSTSCQSR